MKKSDFNRHVGTVLRQVRNNEGITQQELEASSGLQRGFISDLECGRKGISTYKLLQLCNGFSNTTASEFIERLERRLKKHANFY